MSLDARKSAYKAGLVRERACWVQTSTGLSKQLPPIEGFSRALNGSGSYFWKLGYRRKRALWRLARRVFEAKGCQAQRYRRGEIIIGVLSATFICAFAHVAKMHPTLKDFPQVPCGEQRVMNARSGVCKILSPKNLFGGRHFERSPRHAESTLFPKIFSKLYGNIVACYNVSIPALVYGDFYHFWRLENILHVS